MQIKFVQSGHIGLGIHALMDAAMLFMPGLVSRLDRRAPVGRSMPAPRHPTPRSTRPAGGPSVSDRQYGDVHQGLNRMVRIARTLVSAGVRISERYGEPATIQMAHEGLHQAVLHLILDAAQAVRGCGDVDITAQCANDQLVISVRDSRACLSATRALLQPIFGSLHEHHEECSSLGLLMARDFADEHGGTVTNRRCADGATVVSIALPISLPIAQHAMA